ncbi:hypothetical protein RR47_GL002095 [Enterococcus columbae DSM 7374 = ATCC 51263]|nr:hypothetical protein RR47_GL002095 [Enterococcus columbae DSM 7374 = ATCC 51263]
MDFEVIAMVKKITLPEPLFEYHGKKGVILLHAYTGSSADVRLVGRAIEQAGYSIYLPMFSGHGTLNPCDILQQTPNQWQTDVLQAMQYAKSQGVTQLAIFGLSLGGIYALDALTLNEPAIVGGGAFCSPVFLNESQIVPNFKLYTEKVLTYLTESDEKKAQIIETVDQLLPEQLQAIQRFGREVGTKLTDVKVPVFLAQGAKDEMIPAKSVYETAKCITNATLTLRWYEQSGHVITIDKQRKELINDLLYFLDKLSWNED